MKPDIHRYQNLSDLSEAAAEFVVELAGAAVERRSIFTLVLSGGNTPRLLYEKLAQAEFAGRIPWQQTHLFWGDERCLPPDHSHSNFFMALQTLISKVAIPGENVHRIQAEIKPPEIAAKAYETSLRAFFAPDGHQASFSGFPSFDLILLGLGEDGHTASLFPGDAALEETKLWATAVSGSKTSPPVERITLTLPVLNRAEIVMFLVSGSRKKGIVREILTEPKTSARRYPGARIRPSGRLLWFIDEGSA